MPWRLRPIRTLSPAGVWRTPKEPPRPPRAGYATVSAPSPGPGSTDGASRADVASSTDGGPAEGGDAAARPPRDEDDRRYGPPSIAELLARAPAQLDGPEVTVTGNVRTVRAQKAHAFVKLGDGSTTAEVQALLAPHQATDDPALATGAAVAVRGRWRRSPGAEQPVELAASADAGSVRVLGGVDPAAYPLQKKYHSPEFLRGLPHLRLRRPFQALLARLRSEADWAVAAAFRRRDFVRVAPPVITSSDCEGAGETFTLRPRATVADTSAADTDTDADAAERDADADAAFFRAPKYLSVSAQLHLEAFAAEHRRVWALGPAFRAERSDTPRHLSEFAMLEAELQTADLATVTALVEAVLRSLVRSVAVSVAGRELSTPAKHGGAAEEARVARVTQRWRGLLRAEPWPRVAYADAVAALIADATAGRAAFATPPEWGRGLHVEHERHVAATLGGGGPVFVTDYPRALKPFYMAPSDPSDTDGGAGDGDGGDARTTVACFDLLLPDVGEVAGGSLREHRLGPLEARMRAAGLLGARGAGPPDGTGSPDGAAPYGGALDWYLDLRRYGSVPHGGFGLGFDRLLGYLAGVDNVRDVVPWPRYFGRCDG